MSFVTSNGLTEDATGKTVQAGGMTVHYHDLGAGEPVLFLHSYGPGTTAWITFHKVVGALSQHFRCLLMDVPNFSKTAPRPRRQSTIAAWTSWRNRSRSWPRRAPARLASSTRRRGSP